MTYQDAHPEPEIGEVIGAAFSGALAITKENTVPVALLAGYALLCGLLCAAYAGSGKTTNDILVASQGDLFQAAVWILEILVLVVSYFAIAAAVRTVHPAFRMTVGTFFVFLAYQILSAILTLIATLLLFVPGVWIGTKVLLAPYVYALTGGEKTALADSWEMTTGFFWPTFGLWLLLGISVGALVIVAELLAFAALSLPALAIVTFPAAALLLAWLLHVQALGYVLWADGALRRLHALRQSALPSVSTNV